MCPCPMPNHQLGKRQIYIKCTVSVYLNYKNVASSVMSMSQQVKLKDEYLYIVHDTYYDDEICQVA